MNITYICNEYPPRPHGGIGTFVQTAAQAMSRAGHRVTVVGIGDEDAERDDSGVRVVTLKRSPIRLISQFANRRKLRAWLEDQTTRGDCEIIEVPDFQGYLPYSFQSAPVVIRLHLTATIIAQREGVRPRPIFRRFEKRTLACHRNWIGVSQSVIDSTTELFGIQPDSTAVVFSPVPADGTYDVPQGMPEEYILFAGALSRRKGALALGTAAAPLLARHPQLHVVFAGPAQREAGETADSRIRALIGPRNLDRVHFTGRIPQRQVLGLMRNAKGFIFPSSLEAFPLVITEAMRMGCPVVTLALEPFTEFMVDGHNGLLVPPDNPEALSHAIERILTEPSLASRLRIAARQFVDERCSEEAFVRASTHFYETCIDARLSGRSGAQRNHAQ